jgi:transcriptional regulator NrdR family protein
MVCIYCSEETQVVNSRLQRRSNQTWRRRRCLGCESVFTTLEGADYASSLSFRTSQNTGKIGTSKTSLCSFQRDILFVSILESCKHRKTATEDATALTGTVLGRLRPLMTGAIIDRDDVVTITLSVLKKFDRAAAVHYAAFHPL